MTSFRKEGYILGTEDGQIGRGESLGPVLLMDWSVRLTGLMGQRCVGQSILGHCLSDLKATQKVALQKS